MIGKTILHYEILEKLGQGGMGVVYKARDTKLDREVAIKFLPGQIASNSDERKRFEIEARAAAALNHPNIAQVYAIEETDEQMFIVMEYIEGKELRDIVETHDHASLPIETIIGFATQIASGLQAAHEKGIVHRDIKSSNIMVTADGHVKIMDFGLAKIGAGSQLTKDLSTLGTTAYMSPEQASGEKVDQRTDIWSFGVLLYEMLVGETPFKRDYEQAIIYAILNEKPAPLDHNSNIPENIGTVVFKCLQKNIHQRFQTMHDIVMLMAANTQNSVITGKPTPVKNQAHTIAVLPFSNISASKNDEYIADGMTEELIFTLSKISNLRIIARMSVQQFKSTTKSIAQIGKELKVALLLQGSIRKSDQKIRISVQLIETQSETSVWSQVYDRRIEDIISIQCDIASQVASSLKVNLFGDEEVAINKKSTTNTEAYNLYLKGRYFWNKRTESDLMKAIASFEQAIELDKKFALAYAGLADAYIIFGDYNYLVPKNAFPRAKIAAEMALKLNNKLAHAVNALACVNSVFDWNWTGAEVNFKRAMELDPNYAVAHQWYAINFLVPQRRFEEAIREIEIARNIEPWSLIMSVTQGLIYYFAGEFEKAIAFYENTIELDKNFPVVYYFASWACGKAGHYKKAQDYLEKARLLMGESAALLAEKGILYCWSGDEDNAQKIFQQIQQYEDSKKVSAYTMYSFAAFYANHDKTDQAVEWLEKAFNEKSYRLIYLDVDPFFETLKSNPRVIRLLEKMNLKRPEIL